MRTVLPSVVSAALLAGVGTGTKLYPGPGAHWVRNNLGGVFYVVFRCVSAAALLPRTSAVMIAVWVVSVTSALEMLQLWHPSWLETIRATFPGAALLGTTFSWLDFPHYALGGVAGTLWIGWIRRPGCGDER